MGPIWAKSPLKSFLRISGAFSEPSTAASTLPRPWDGANGLHWAMPKPSPSEPEPRKGPAKIVRTPEEVAKILAAKLKSPVGQTHKVELPLRLVLPREVAEHLMVRANTEGRRLEALLQEILEVAAQESLTSPRRARGSR
jgi:hypothetical protein